MKKGFRNYNFTFDKNERRMISAFCRQVLKQTGGDQKFFHIERIFQSVLAKVGSQDETIKLTKEEYLGIAEHLKENVRMLKNKIKNTWFLMKWIYKSMLTSYEQLLENHFKD